MIEEMLTNMFIGKPPGNYDRILDFSTAVTGNLFFVPTVDFLDDPWPGRLGDGRGGRGGSVRPRGRRRRSGGRVTGNRQPEVGRGPAPASGQALEPTITSSTTVERTVRVRPRRDADRAARQAGPGR